MRTLLPCLLGVALLVSCGGRDPETPKVTPPPVSTTRPVTLEGLLGGQEGALELGGLALDTTGCTVSVDGESTVLEEVQPGMFVEASGIQSATGDRVQVSDLKAHSLLRGTLTAIDATKHQFTVLGKTIKTDDKTRFAAHGSGQRWIPLAFGDFKVGDAVALHGLPQSDGSILATRVERLPALGEVRPMAGVQGSVANLDATAKTFQVGSTKVDYSQARVVGTLAQDAKVLVLGHLEGSLLKAKHVVVLPQPPTDRPRLVSGHVSDLDDKAKTFKVGMIKVDYAKAKVEGTLANRAMVLVEGLPLATDRATLVASKVWVKK